MDTTWEALVMDTTWEALGVDTTLGTMWGAQDQDLGNIPYK